MKRILLCLCVLVAIKVYSQPTIDGTFDGTGTWGSSIASDGDGSWAGVDLDDLYVTFDDTYVYFGTTFTTLADWQHWGYVINTITGGGSSEAYGYAGITYGHSNLPNYIIRGRLDGGGAGVELVSWNGSSYSYSSLAGTEWSADETNSIIEVRVPRSSLGNPVAIDVQFYVTGNVAGEHGTFDAIPDDELADSWNESSAPNTLDNYATSIPVTYTASTDGTWSTSGTWYRSMTPGSTSAVNIAANVTLNQDATVSSLTISSGTFTASDGSARTLTFSRSASGSATTITNSGGTWANGTGGSTVVFTGAPSSGDAIHSTSGTLGFQNVTINKTGGSSNVGVDFTTNSSVSGTLQIGEGGFVSSAPPASFYGASATLEFNQGGAATYNVGVTDNTWSTTEIPNNITVTSGTVNLNADRTATGDLIVSSGAALNLAENVELEINGTLNLGGDITLNASASGYSQLKVDGSVSGSGSVTVEQYVGTTGWHNMSLPVSTNLDAFGTVNTAVHANTRNVYTWNESTTSWVDVAGATNGSSTAASAGTGYMVYVGSNGVISAAGNIDATGSLFGSTTPTLTNAGSGDDAGWNLVGNPFPCAIDYFTLSTSDVSNGYSIWNPGSSNYSSWTPLSAGTEAIAPMQAFWVEATGGSPTLGSISMASNGDVGQSPAFLKTQTVIADRFYLDVFEAADHSKRDEFLLGMVPGTNDGRDNQWDFGKRLNASTVPSLMSVAGGDELAINAIDYSPNSIKTKKLQLRFVSGKQNEVYFIELHDSLLSNNYHIELEDLKLRRKHNLNNGAYKFVHDQAAEYRFVLHISSVTTINQGHTHTPVVSGGVNVGINGGMLVLKMDAPAQDVSGALLDLNGRRVMEVEYPAGAEQYELNVNGLAKGIYLLQLQSATGEEVLKVMIP